MGSASSGRKTAAELALVKDRVVAYIAKGHTVAEALARVDRSEAAYKTWRRNDRDFAARVDRARDVNADAVEGRRAAIPSFEEFSRDYLDQPLYRHQLQWVDLLEGREPRDLHPSQKYRRGLKNMVLVNTPPEHAKSTTITINYLTYRICQNPNIRILIISDTQDMAKDFLFSIKQRLTHPDYAKLQHDFAPDGGFDGKGSIWQSAKIFLGSGVRSGKDKDATVQALGVGNQVYGRRADIVVVDDAVVLNNAHEYEKQIKFLRQDVLTRLGPTGLLLVVGTRVAPVDMYSELLNPENYNDDDEVPWTHLTQPAVLEYDEDPRKWVTLWPRAQEPWLGDETPPDADGLYPRWDGIRLRARRGIVGARTWSLVYMQHDVAENATFSAEAINRCVNGARKPGPLVPGAVGHRAHGMNGLYVVGSLDPAIAGFAGMIVGGVDRESKKRYVLDVLNAKAPSPAWIRDKMLALTERYGIKEWRVEENAYQRAILVDEPLRTGLGSQGCMLVPHWTGRNKIDPDFGVASMAPLFDTGLIELPSTAGFEAGKQLITQLISWVPGLNSNKLVQDLVMALWFFEIRAREICANTLGGGGHFVNNRFLSRGARKRQYVVSARDMARGSGAG